MGLKYVEENLAFGASADGGNFKEDSVVDMMGVRSGCLMADEAGDAGENVEDEERKEDECVGKEIRRDGEK